MKTGKFVVLIMCIYLVVLAFLCGCDYNYDFTPKPTTPICNPKIALEEFVDCLKSRDFEKGNEYVSNYVDLGYVYENQSDTDAVAAFFYECLLDSYSLEFIDNDNIVSITDSVSETDYVVKGADATVDFRFTVVDTSLITARMTELATEIGHDYMFNGYVYDSDEKAEALILEVLEVVKKEPVEQYYKTYELSVNMTYADNMWKMEMTDDFYDILLGGHVE